MKIEKGDIDMDEIKPEIKLDINSPGSNINNSNTNNNQSQESISIEIVQKILHLYSSSKNSGEKIENNITKPLSSIKYTLFNLVTENEELDNNSEYYLNPLVKAKEKINNISKLNTKIKRNMSNSQLQEKIKSYYELKNKIKNYKKNNEDISEKLYIINHPLISLFENDIINYNELKNDIQKDFKNKMKINTNEKFVIAPPPLNENENNNEDNDDNSNSSQPEIINMNLLPNINAIWNNEFSVDNNEEDSESDEHSHSSGSENEPLMDSDHSDNQEEHQPLQPMQNNHGNGSNVAGNNEGGDNIENNQMNNNGEENNDDGNGNHNNNNGD